MPQIRYIYETISDQAYRLGLSLPIVPKYITDNLKYELFQWQKKAFENFLIFQSVKEKQNPNTPTHLMFNMATGSGKTLVMASNILYYYARGYRHFVFFVNQNNIVDKTENNFIDSLHDKYLFKEKIVIDDQTVDIKKVETFSDNPENIEIKFTTIHKLYNDIHTKKENKTTLDDLQNRDIVMIADEAHHLNANTKKINIQKNITIEKLKGSKDEVEKKGWEHTVINLILNKNNQTTNNKNVLLEYTATIPQDDQVAEKYKDKIIFKYTLKEFLKAGYTKEINLISSTLDKKQRVFQALLFQWYRHKIALKHGIANFKPVILFRSKTIEESKVDSAEFLDWVANTSSKDFTFFDNISTKIHQAKEPSLYEQGKSRTEKVLMYIKNEGIKYVEIADWVQNSFQEKNSIITNSKTNKTKTEKTTQDQEKLLNSLENSSNHIRAIFTVDRLTEGWDVLNLFDIVRLYQGQNSGGSDKKTPKITTKEKQLIGRGVRYCPFIYKDKIKNKRKFDDDLDHELRVLEELYYYTYDEESRYISHLKQELRKDGYITDDKSYKTFAIKEQFRQSKFYKNTKIWHNTAIINPDRQKKTLDSIKKDFFPPYKIQELEFSEQSIDLNRQEEFKKLNLKQNKLHTINLKLKEIDKHIVQKAINIKAKQDNSLCRFNKLKKELYIDSIDDLQEDKLSDFDIKIIVKKNIKFEDISAKNKLKIATKFLDCIFAELKENIAPKIGSEFKPSKFGKFFDEPKTKTINKNNLKEDIAKNNDWYVLDSFVGTSEERSLVKFIKESIGNLQEKYKEIYLLRNEERYKIYDFDKGRGFMPDFMLFLKDADELYYQVFIEPKGTQLLQYDSWKEKFLDDISTKYGLKNILQYENKNYKLIGLPFFNDKDKQNFMDKYQTIIN